MAKWALISGSRVCQVEDAKFEVAGDLTWVECGDEITIDYEYINDEFVAKPKLRTEYVVARKVGYGDIGSQLGAIYDALNSGADANVALESWARQQRLVKVLFPKDDDDAMNAAHDEVLRRQEAYLIAMEEAGDYSSFKQPSFFTLQVAEDYVAGRWVNPVSGPYTGEVF